MYTHSHTIIFCLHRLLHLKLDVEDFEIITACQSICVKNTLTKFDYSLQGSKTDKNLLSDDQYESCWTPCIYISDKVYIKLKHYMY